MKKFIQVLYCLLILTFAFPSGTFFGFPLKVTLVFLLFLSFILYNRKINLDVLTKVFLFSLLGLIIWSIYAVIDGYLETTFSFAISYFSLLIIVWLSYEFYCTGIVSNRIIVKLISLVSILVIFLTILSSMVITTGFLTNERMINLFIRVFNYQPMTLLVSIGGFSYYRVQMVNNVIAFIWLSYTLVMKRNFLYKLFVLLLVGLMTLISFSRLAIAEYLVVIAASILIFLFKNEKMTKDQAAGTLFISIIVVAAFVAFIAVFGSTITEFIQLRFNSETTKFSDSFRDVQKTLLLEAFSQRPLIGFGAGSYLENYIRSTTALYSYEKEYLSFLYQFGIFGFAWIIVSPIVGITYICLSNTDNKVVRAMVVINLLLWLIKPLFNPTFLSSNSGIIIASIFTYSHLKPYKIKMTEINAKTVTNSEVLA